MKILNRATMRNADQRTSEEYGLPGLVLMETAGIRVVEFILSLKRDLKRIVVLAGPGNNGGDGLAAARLLAGAGFSVSIWSTVKSGAYRGDAAVNEKFLLKAGFFIRRLTASADLDQFRNELGAADLLIDALLGIGVDRDLDGLMEETVNCVNSSGVPVVAVDIPSGVNADSGAVMGCAIKADWSVTFGFPKQGLLLHPGAGLAGEIVVADINVPGELVKNEPVDLLTPEYIRKILPGRPSDGHKGSMGRVLIVAGSPGMTGAALLTAESALQGGAGLVYLAAPESVCPALEAKTVEVITIALPEKTPGIIDPTAAEEVIEKARACDALVVGPGLDTGEATSNLLFKLIQLSPVPIVLDAGALEAMGRKLNILRSARHAPVITPHPGEMARLLGKSADQVQASRLETALKNAQLWNCVIILKGSNTITATPEGKVSINPTGGPELATAGSGDLLTGLVASFIAQGMAPEDAARAGPFVHGLAGDLLPPGRGHMARDVLDYYKEAFHCLETADMKIPGYPFLQRTRVK